MRIPKLTLCENGTHLWTGSALDFVKANDFDRDEIAEMRATLRGVPGNPPEPFIYGGGAAPLFTVALA